MFDGMVPSPLHRLLPRGKGSSGSSLLFRVHGDVTPGVPREVVIGSGNATPLFKRSAPPSEILERDRGGTEHGKAAAEEKKRGAEKEPERRLGGTGL